MDSQILEMRRKARQEKLLVDARLVSLHQKAVNALLNANGSKVRQRALEQVNKWERGHLCSPDYIRAWREILSLPANKISEHVLQNDVKGIALRQNSPFGFLMRGEF